MAEALVGSLGTREALGSSVFRIRLIGSGPVVRSNSEHVAFKGAHLARCFCNDSGLGAFPTVYSGQRRALASPRYTWQSWCQRPTSNSREKLLWPGAIQARSYFDLNEKSIAGPQFALAANCTSDTPVSIFGAGFQSRTPTGFHEVSARTTIRRAITFDTFSRITQSTGP